MSENPPTCIEHIDQERFGTSLNFDFMGLLAVRRRGLRNGNWRRLSLVDRGLFRCAMWVARVRGGIANWKLLAKVLSVFLKLLESHSTRIWIEGKVRAEELKRRFEDRRLFDWAPRAKGWLTEKCFVFYLGLGYP